MMKMLLGLAAAVAVSSTALAADMPRKAQPLVQEAAYPQYWNGFYIGGNAGWAMIDTDPSLFTRTSRPSGWTYGGDIGYSRQHGWLVVGIEASITNFSNVKTNGMGCDCLVADFVGKLGFTPTPTTQVYVLGGGFWHNAVTGGVVPDFGWELGTGAAWKPFDNHWTVGVEYRYRHLDLPNSKPDFSVFSHAVQGKLSYQFGG